jgi:hypothetical protein
LGEEKHWYVKREELVCEVKREELVKREERSWWYVKRTGREGERERERGRDR